MGLETATYINGLVPSNPTQGDLISAGDDHIRLIKSALRNTFPNIAGAITVSHVELNYLAGVSSAIQTQLNAKAAASHSHLETEIQDGNTFPRISANETILGQWAFNLAPTVGGNAMLTTASDIPETRIADGTLLARLAANETITGNWNFQGGLLKGGLGILNWITAGLTSGQITLQNGGTPAPTGTPGNIVLVY